MTTSINTMLKNRKNRKNKKGFSLVELIVVLVIMAILAAALVPTLIGYINQTRQSNSKNEAASAVQAAQTIVSSAYASPDKTFTSNTSDVPSVVFAAWSGTHDDDDYCTAAENLSEVDQKDGDVKSITIADGVVTGLEYEAANGDKVSYSDGTYTVS